MVLRRLALWLAGTWILAGLLGMGLMGSLKAANPTFHEILQSDQIEWRTVSFVTPLPQKQRIDPLRQAIENRTSLVIGRWQQFVSYDPEDFGQYPFIHLEMCGSPPPLELEAIFQWRDFFSNGGTLYLDHCSGGPFSAWKNWATRIFPKSKWNEVTREHPLTFSFYILPKHLLLHQGRASLWSIDRLERSVIIMNQHPAHSWQTFLQSKVRVGGNPGQVERVLRYHINLMMYLLTGNYKQDQLHLPTILLRRK